MEFYLNFDKPHVSEKVFNFLEININEENAKKNLARLAKGQKLLYKEANEFIHTLLKALTIEDGKEDLPFVPSKINEGEKGDSLIIIIISYVVCTRTLKSKHAVTQLYF